jgi:hypothetical protein
MTPPTAMDRDTNAHNAKNSRSRELNRSTELRPLDAVHIEDSNVARPAATTITPRTHVAIILAADFALTFLPMGDAAKIVQQDRLAGGFLCAANYVRIRPGFEVPTSRAKGAREMGHPRCLDTYVLSARNR